jgi:3,4-dihydroxy 2-butanone 4-phosphate synthase/GTP cyclohydrolase II
MGDLKITKMTSARIPTVSGEFQLSLYLDNQNGKEHLALTLGDVAGQQDVLARMHSECFTGDVLGSLRCDCGEQLERAMRLIGEEGRGVLIYLRQEGRGIGLLSKLRAYNLQDAGYDTVDANLALGHQVDERDYLAGALILRDLQVCSIRLLTNNPLKIKSLQDLGIPVTARLPLESRATAENATYLITKAQRMNHLLNLDSLFDVLAHPSIPRAVRDGNNGINGSD